MSKCFENVIVGSGPAAYICALELIRHGEHCTIVTPTLGRHKSPDKVKESKWGGKLFLKDRFTKPWVYTDSSKRFAVNGEEIDVTETDAFGGLSSIWGAVSFPPLSTNEFLPSLSLGQINELLLDLKDILRINAPDSEFWSLNNAVIPESGFFLQDRQPPIARSANGGPWNVEDEWKLLDQDYITFFEGFVCKVSRSENNTIVLTLDESKDSNTEIFCKRVFFACGPFGNARVILNSCEELESIKIADSAVSYKVFLDLTLQKNFEFTMEPRTLFLHSTSGSMSNIRYLQVYNLSWQLIQSFKFKRLHRVLKSCARMLAPFISVGLEFRSSTESHSIILERVEFGALAGRISDSYKPMLRSPRFIWRLIRSGIIPLPIIIKGKPGSGVHSGAFLGDKFSSVEKALILNHIHETNGVYFVGASNLSKIPAGPVTLVGLMHSLFTTRKVCRNA